MGALLSELRAEGQHDASGRFTLDLTQARTKLGRFQLAGYHFLIPLVACAVLSEAGSLELQIKSDELELEFDGRPLDTDTLRSLFSHLLSGQAFRRLRELAIGINSAMGAGYQVVLESQGRLTVKADRFTVEELPLPRRKIHLRLHRATPVWKRLLPALGPPREALAVLERYCAQAPLELSVQGKALRKPVDLGPCLVWSHLEPDSFAAAKLMLAEPDSPLHRRTSSGSSMSAVLGLKPEATGVRFVVDGVLTLESPVFLGCIFVEGVVLSSGLTRDLSGTGLVQDERLALLVEVLRQEVLAMLGELAVHFEHFQDQERELARRVLLDSLRSTVKADQHVPGMSENPLLDLPWFELAGGEITSLRPLLDQYARLSKLPTVRLHHEVRPERGPLILRVTAENEGLLATIFPDWEDHDPALGRLAHADAARRRWEAQVPSRPQLPEEGHYLVRETLRSLEGEVGLTGEPHQVAAVHLLKHRRTLGSWGCATLPRGLVATVNHDGLIPSPHFDGVNADDPALGAIETAVEAVLHDLYAGLPTSGVSRVDVGPALLAYLAYLGPPPTLPSERRLPMGLQQFDTFPTVQGVMVSLYDLLEEVRKVGFVGVLPPNHSELRSGDMPGFLAVNLNAACTQALRAYLGVERVRDARAEIQRLKSRPEFYTRAVQMAVLSGDLIVRKRFEGGEVGLQFDADWEPEARVRVLLHGRLLSEARRLPLEFGPLVAVADSQDLTPAKGLTGPYPDEAWQRWLERISRECRLLLPVAVTELSLLVDARRRLTLKLVSSQLRWELARPPDATFRELAETVTFPDLQGRRHTLKAVLAAREAGRAGFVSAPPALDVHLFDDEVVLLGEKELYEPLELPAFDDELRVRMLESQGQAPVSARLAPQKDGTLLTLQPLSAFQGELGVLADLERASRVELLCRHQRCRVLEPRTSVPYLAIVNRDDLLRTPRATEEVLAQLETEAIEAILQLVRRPKAANREYLLRLAVRSSLRGQPPALVIQLRRAPLVRDLVSQSLISLEQLSSAAAYAMVEQLAEIPYKSLQAIAKEDRLEYLPVLSPGERELLTQVCTLLPLSEEFRLRARAHHNRNRPRLEQLDLETHFPHQEWLARLDLQPFGLQGQVGVPVLARSENHWLVCRERLLLARLQPSGPGLCGIVDGPFEPNPAWDGLAQPEEALSALGPALTRLRGELARALPGSQPALRSRILGALALWPTLEREIPSAPEYAACEEEAHMSSAPRSAGDLQALRNLFGSLLVRSGARLREDPLAMVELDEGREAPLAVWSQGRLRLSALAVRSHPGMLIHPLYVALAPVYPTVRQLSPRQIHLLLLELT